MKLVIDRSKWIRGSRTESYLLRQRDGKMCCLGFYSLACGLKPEEIQDVAAPSGVFIPWRNVDRNNDVFKKLVRPPVSMLSDNPTCANLMGTNDNPRISDDEREASLTQQFAAIGVEVEFVDEAQK